jgi:hypothetical protein
MNEIPFCDRSRLSRAAEELAVALATREGVSVRAALARLIERLEREAKEQTA